ncbi:hypothetical protein OEZ86_011881 [Tetradesmus obliquus]|nr:hypothetical protein OEZ86_011881 [Tetradesmus obliquus]
MQAGAARQPRYAAADKLHLTPEAAQDIARRLRKAGPPKPGQPVLRVFRYGIDDLRLYKALDVAGLEGRVVVVDTMQFADAVLTSRNKRTGKAVNLAEARRAAQAAGVPLFVLRAVSAQRVLEALGPLLELQREPQQQFDVAGQSQQAAQGGGGSSPAAADAAAAAAVAAADFTGGAAAVLECVRSADVEDAREALLPANPTQLAGERYKLHKPLRHGSRLRRRRLQRDLRLQQAPW